MNVEMQDKTNSLSIQLQESMRWGDSGKLKNQLLSTFTNYHTLYKEAGGNTYLNYTTYTSLLVSILIGTGLELILPFNSLNIQW